MVKSKSKAERAKKKGALLLKRKEAAAAALAGEHLEPVGVEGEGEDRLNEDESGKRLNKKARFLRSKYSGKLCTSSRGGQNQN